MHANRVSHVALLAVVVFALAACTLGGAGEAGVPTPTLITPVTLPPTEELPPTVASEETPVAEVTTAPEATVAPSPDAAAVGGPGEYTVARGEWIWAIARRLGINPDDIIAANPAVQANPDLIHPNQKLVIPGVPGAAAAPAPGVQPTEGAASLPRVDQAAYQALLTESLAPVDAATCSTAASSTFAVAWARAEVGPRLGCASEEALDIGGLWLEFGPGSRIIWIRELDEFHAITGAGFGQRWVFADNSGLPENEPPRPGPDGSSGYTPTAGRFAWLLGAHPEVASIFSPAFGDENVIVGQYQRFANGAILFDGALMLVFFDDAGPWWYLIQ